MTQPISAPPLPEEVDEEYQEARRVIASAHVPSRVIMRVSNRYNYSHYYTMPADVGYQNVPGLIRAMQEEGCKITDIQITFEVQELK